MKLIFIIMFLPIYIAVIWPLKAIFFILKGLLMLVGLGFLFGNM